MITYRVFRNSDPPQMVDVWNASVQGRGWFTLLNPAILDRWIFSKIYFDHDALTLAVDQESNRIVGFVLAGFGPSSGHEALDLSLGVVCALIVHPEFRGRGIGRTLLAHGEDYLRRHGAQRIVFGAQRPANPYMFGLYGGANSPGILESEPDAESFLNKCGYFRGESHLIYQVSLDSPIDVGDARFINHRREYNIETHYPTTSSSWWEECVWGPLEPTEYRLVDKLRSIPAGQLVHWDMQGFSQRWKNNAAGLFDIETRIHLRGKGLAKFLMTSILRLLQDAYYNVAELQIWNHDPAGMGICKALGFEQIDVGYQYDKRSS